MFWKPAEEKDTVARRDLAAVEMPDAAMFEASALHILSGALGMRKSAERGVGMLGDERIIPMMSYGLVEYLMGLDLSAFDVLELGGGYSTEFWSLRVRSLLTFETDPEWVRQLAARDLLQHRDLRHHRRHHRRRHAERALDRRFDAIIIDASANRYRCAKAALTMLKPGGFILLDNADWYPNTTALLRAGIDLIQVDFSDFRPQRGACCATSLFLHRDFRAKPRYGRAACRSP